MNITQINNHDIDEILTLFYETVHHVNARDYSQDQLEAWVSKRDINEMREKWIRSFDENVSYKAIVDEKIVGFADMDSSGLLDRLYVHKDYQGQGVASALLNKLEEEARKNDIQNIETFASITAKPFFEKRGFQVLFSQKVFRKGVELTNYKMVKRVIQMYAFLPMTDEAAEEIAYQWNYDGEYSFYNMTEDQEDLKEFLHPDRSGYYTVEKDGEMIGYFCFQKKESDSVDIGLGMNPALTGNGLGLEYVLEGMKFAIANFQPSKLSLSVATFNQRAIKVYEKAGFLPIETFKQDTNGSTYDFLKMEYEVEENDDVFNAGNV